MSSFAKNMKALLDRRAEQHVVPDGFLRCPFDKQHVVPYVVLVAHLEEHHACDDLALAADAMYSAQTAQRRVAYLTHSSHVLSRDSDDDAAVDARPLHDDHVSTDSDLPSTSRSSRSSSRHSSSRTRTESSGSEYSLSSNRHRRTTGHKRSRSASTGPPRSPPQDAGTQTSPGLLPCPTPAVLQTSEHTTHSIVPLSSVGILPAPAPQPAPVAATINPLTANLVMFSFSPSLSPASVQLDVLKALSGEEASSFAAATEVRDVVVHDGVGFVVCTTGDGVAEVRRLLLAATVMAPDAGAAKLHIQL